MKPPAVYARLALAGRVRLLHLDMPRRSCMVRIAPPATGGPAWPRNVVALRKLPYELVASLPGISA